MNATNCAPRGWGIDQEPSDHDRVVALYDAHVNEVYRYVHRMCLSQSLAEDVTQDVFVAALTVPIADLTVGWLIRSARNRLIDVVRRETTQGDKLRLLRGTTERDHDEFADVVEHIRIRDGLARLRREHRIVLMLHYVEDIPVADLAEALGRSYKGAEGLLSRARAALRAELEGDR